MFSFQEQEVTAILPPSENSATSYNYFPPPPQLLAGCDPDLDHEKQQICTKHDPTCEEHEVVFIVDSTLRITRSGMIMHTLQIVVTAGEGRLVVLNGNGGKIPAVHGDILVFNRNYLLMR